MQHIIWLRGRSAIGALGFLGGYGVGSAFPVRDFALGWLLLIAGVLYVLMWLIGKWATDKLTRLIEHGCRGAKAQWVKQSSLQR